MASRTTSKQRIARMLSVAILLTMVIFLLLHVLGNWRVENFRRDPDTTAEIRLHNHCLIFDHPHMLRPNTAVPDMTGGINEMKLTGGFMIFYEGHIGAMILGMFIIAFLLVGVQYLSKRKDRSVAQ